MSITEELMAIAEKGQNYHKDDGVHFFIITYDKFTNLVNLSMLGNPKTISECVVQGSKTDENIKHFLRFLLNEMLS